MSWLIGSIEMESPSGLVQITLRGGLLRWRWRIIVSDEVLTEGGSWRWRNSWPSIDAICTRLPSLPVPAQRELIRLLGAGGGR